MSVQLAIKNVIKTVSYWNNLKGQGVKVDGETDTKSWLIDCDYLTDVVKSYETMDELKSNCEKDFKEYLSKNLYSDVKYLIIMDDGRIDTNFIENGDSEILDIEEQERTEKDGNQLYICDYSFDIEIREVFEPNANMLCELFPSAER